MKGFRDSLLKDLDTTFFNPDEFATTGLFVFYKNAVATEKKELLYVEYSDVVENGMAKRGLYSQDRAIFLRQSDLPPYVSAGSRLLFDNLQYSVAVINPQDGMVKLSMERNS